MIPFPHKKKRIWKKPSPIAKRKVDWTIPKAWINLDKEIIVILNIH
jgi:hypothetical protein